VAKWLLRLSITVVLVIFFFAGVFVLVVELYPFNAGKLTPSTSPTIIYDVNGNKYASIAGPGSDDLSSNQIPKNLQDALVSIEDHNFWNSSSVDAKGLLRAAFVDLWSRQLAQGGSTIQEQLAKIVYLTDKKTFQRKIEQIVLGVQINRYFTKQEILSMYLNRVYLGDGATGVEQASQRYFGIDLRKNPQKLTLNEAALLAGLPQAPSAYDPLVNPSAAKQRRNEVLEAMAKYGYISEATAKKTEAEKLPVTKAHSISGDIWESNPLFAQFLFDYANQSGIDPTLLTQGGMKVYTTINPQVQNAIDTVFLNPAYKGYFAPSVNGQAVPAAAVFVNPATGGITGAAGSHTVADVHGLDRAFEDGQPGSSIKPILDYGPALETGKWGPNSILNNTPHDFGGGYTPQNDEPNQPARVTMSYALKESENVAAVWMLQQIGINTGKAFAEKDGIQFAPSDNTLGIAIGGMAHGVTAYQMAQAYEPFAAQGVQQKEHLITRIVNDNGDTVYSFQPQAKQIMSAKTAAVMTQMLMGVVSGGTGTGAQVPGWDVAGKTGTVQYDAKLTGPHSSWLKLAWFDGYTPNLVGSIYMGWNNDGQGNPAYHTTGYQSYQCSQIFGLITRLAEQGVTPQHFNFGQYSISAQNNAVTNLKATYLPVESSVSLSWKTGISGAPDFVVSRATGVGVTNDASFAQLGQVATPSYLDATIQPGNSYTYRVQAVDSSGSAIGAAATVTVNVPASPPVNSANTTGPNNTPAGPANTPAGPANTPGGGPGSGGGGLGGNNTNTAGTNPSPPTNPTGNKPSPPKPGGNKVGSPVSRT